MKAAVYLRVSSKTGRQDEANQEPDCLRLCAQRGWEPVIFRERESGAKARPEWQRVVDAARRGNVGAVVFWALDRTGRTRTEVARDLAMLGHYNVVLASVQDAWLEQPLGSIRDLLIQVFAWVAEGERQRLIERTRAGLDRARALGRTLGRPRVNHAGLPAALSAVRNGMPVSRAAVEHRVPRATLRAALGSLGVVAKKGGLA